MNNKTAFTIGFVGMTCVLATGCATNVADGMFTGDRGRILINADAEGMNAFSDMIQGSITNGKASPDSDTAHYGVRREQVRARAFTSYGKATKVVEK